MENMERECENVHSWNEFSEKEPVCSEKCQKAIINLSLNSIGYKWTICDCHKSKPAAFFTLLRDDDFERKCLQSKHNQYSYCFHKVSCKGICNKVIVNSMHHQRWILGNFNVSMMHAPNPFTTCHISAPQACHSIFFYWETCFKSVKQ